MLMKDAIVLVTRYGMGSADEKLQLALIAKYLELLIQGGNLPAAICFYTDGVRLVCEGSPVLEQLQKLESLNVRLISCSTCLNSFGLQTQVRAGIVGGMGDILEAQIQADKVISI
jgi:sulfur relay (sulfurtransferase) complex TusBCD TusD component (DsrE family)